MAERDKFTRLLHLVAVLEFTEHPLTQREILERLPEHYRGEGETVRRKFERDKSDLLDMGVRLRTEAVPGSDPPVEGYRIAHDRTVMGESAFDAAELAALQSAVAALALRHTDPSEVLDPAGGLRKLGGIGRGDAEPGEAELAVDANLAATFEAIVDRKAVVFAYRGDTRRVVPRRILQLDGHWYLDGIDQDRRAQRNFRFDRIDGAVLPVAADAGGEDDAGRDGSGEQPAHDAPARRAPSTSFRPWEFGSGEATPVRVHLDPPVAAAALAADDGLQVVGRDDGGIEVELAVRDEGALSKWLFEFLDHAELLGPAGVRARFVDRLAALAGEG